MNSKKKKIIQEKIHESITSTKLEIEDFKRLTQPISPENAIGRISRMDAINN